MGCTITQVQKTPIDSISSFSSDDLQESEFSLDQIHEEIAYLKMNVEKQKEIYPEESITMIKKLVNCYNSSFGTSKKSETNSKKSCLKSQSVKPPLSQSKKVHFFQLKQINTHSQNCTKKKNKKKHSRKQIKHINLDEIF